MGDTAVGTGVGQKIRRRVDAIGWKTFLAIAFLTLTFVAAIGTPLFGQTRFFSGDLVLNRAPWSEEVYGQVETKVPRTDFIDGTIGYYREQRDRLYAGDFPEWDPLSAAGADLSGTPSTGAYSPLSWPYFVLPLTYAPAAVKFLELWVAFGGTFLLARRIGFVRVAAVGAGLVFAFNGFQTMWTSWPQSSVGAFIPWVFWAAERLVQRRRAIDVVPLAVSMGALLAGGFPAVAAYVVWTLAAYLVGRQVLGLAQDRWLARRDQQDRPTLRAWLGEQIHAGILLSVGLAAGVGLVAFVLIPQYNLVADDVLAGRAGASEGSYPTKLAATLVFPHAFGVLNQSGWFAPSNAIEVVGYVGGTALALGVAAFLFLRIDDRRLRSLVPAAVLFVFVAMAIYVGGPPNQILSKLPGISTSPIGRMRSMLGLFGAIVCAGGLQALVDRVPTTGVRRVVRPVVALGGMVFLVIAVVKIRQNADSRGQLEVIANWQFIPPLLVAGVIALFVAPRRWGRSLVAAVAVGLIAVESLSFVVPFFPRVANDLALPVTETHEFLRAEQTDQGRIATDGLTLYPGTTRFYGLSTLTSHAFHPPEYKALLSAFDPAAFAQSPTLSVTSIDTLSRMQDGILDRAAVDLVVLPLDVVPFGTRLAPIPAGTSNGRAQAVGLPGALRGMILNVATPVPFDSPEALRELVIEVRADGEVVGRTSRRFGNALPAEPIPMAFAGEDIAFDASVSVDAWLLDEPTGETREIDLASVVPIVAADDGLQLLDTSGAQVWRRESALPRFRWASEVVVIADQQQRLTAMKLGLSPRAVVLEHRTDAAPAGDGEVTGIDVDDPDDVSVTVASESGGYLVIADNLRAGWTATVDAQATPLLDAEQAFAAVYVPAGSHTVGLTYTAPGAPAGRLVSVVAVGVLVAIVALATWRNRSRPRIVDGSTGELP